MIDFVRFQVSIMIAQILVCVEVTRGKDINVADFYVIIICGRGVTRQSFGSLRFVCVFSLLELGRGQSVRHRSPVRKVPCSSTLLPGCLLLLAGSSTRPRLSGGG